MPSTPPWLVPVAVAALLTWLVTWLTMRAQIVALVRRERHDALARGRATLRGQVAEQLAPLLPDFPYEPEDARFLGAPIDYVVFAGLSDEEGDDQGESDGDPDHDVEIVFLEVKTGNARLSEREARIRDAVRAGRVRFETLRIQP
jgi:predicted Holliday junction resolvase-like endonuclease